MKITLLTFLLIVNVGFTQSNPNSELTMTEFESAKMLYVKMMESPDYKEKEKLNDELMPMLKESSAFPNFLKIKPTSENQILEWIKSNVSREKVEKATDLFTQVIQLEAKIFTENQELYDYIRRSSKEQRLKIFEPYFKKTQAKYGF